MSWHPVCLAAAWPPLAQQPFCATTLLRFFVQRGPLAEACTCLLPLHDSQLALRHGPAGRLGWGCLVCPIGRGVSGRVGSKHGAPARVSRCQVRFGNLQPQELRRSSLTSAQFMR